MAETLLSLVNLALKANGGIQTDLTALTSNSNQQDVDNMISAINEVVDDLSGMGVWPSQYSTGTLTLLVNTRAYAPATDFVELAPGPPESPSGLFIDTTNGMYLTEYPGGYARLRADQSIPANATGLPYHWTIRPTDGKFYLNSIPQAADVLVTRAYSYEYLTATSYVSSTPTASFPFVDEVVQRLVPSVIQVFNRDRRPERYSETQYMKALSLATSVVGRVPMRTHYGPR